MRGKNTLRDHDRPASKRGRFIPALLKTACLDAGVPLRDVQEAASHADPRTARPEAHDSIVRRRLADPDYAGGAIRLVPDQRRSVLMVEDDGAGLTAEEVVKGPGHHRAGRHPRSTRGGGQRAGGLLSIVARFRPLRTPRTGSPNH